MLVGRAQCAYLHNFQIVLLLFHLQTVEWNVCSFILPTDKNARVFFFCLYSTQFALIPSNEVISLLFFNFFYLSFMFTNLPLLLFFVYVRVCILCCFYTFKLFVKVLAILFHIAGFRIDETFFFSG